MKAIFTSFKGFTLIELLVVISILSILGTSAVALVNPAEQLKKARDSQRKYDLRQLRTALEDYNNEYNRYPPDTSNRIDGISWGNPWPPYMAILPKDPLSPTQDYAYEVTSISGDGYRLCAKLERCTQDPDRILGTGCAGSYNYAVASPNEAVVACSGAIVLPTATPTLAPTATLTPVPTATPTRAPTATPTVTPTRTPTPTITPTRAPTATPTVTPTPTITPTPTPVPCWVATSPGLYSFVVGGTGQVSASVTSGLGSASIIQMRFGSYNTTITTVSPESDSSSPYSTTVTALASGATAVWATAYLDDNGDGISDRTCPSTGTTDTDINVSLKNNGEVCSSDSVCLSGICGTDADGDGYFSQTLGHTGTCQAIAKPYTDCMDISGYSGFNVHPNQTQFFSSAYSTWPGTSFDYDCDETIEYHFPNINTITATPGVCYTSLPAGHAGWIGSVPACGDWGSSTTCAGFFNSDCTNVREASAAPLDCTDIYGSRSWRILLTSFWTQECR